MLVCIAGTDGSGKSTLVANLQKALSNDHTCTALRLYNTQLQFKWQKEAARILVRKRVKPTHYNLVIAYLMLELEQNSLIQLETAMKEHEIVLSDRYLETIDFIVKNYDVDQSLLTDIVNKFPKPDVYLYLDTSPKVCYERIISDRIPGDGEQLHEIEAASLYYLSNQKKYGYETIDGRLGIQELCDKTTDLIRKRVFIRNIT